MRPAVPIACFVVGVVLMVGFEATVTRILGVVLLFAFIVSGVFVVADPAFLAAEEDADAP
jgi:uncharacterized membrane protein YoaK (UPF0700 family)